MKRQGFVLIFSLQLILFLTNCGDSVDVLKEVCPSEGLRYDKITEIQDEDNGQSSIVGIGKIDSYVMKDLDSVYKEFYDNGHIKSEVTIINGRKNGFYKKYDSLIDLPITVIEYIKTPIMFKSIKTADYVNRVWNYIDGDTNAIDSGSELYIIKLNKAKTGIDIYVHISNFSSLDDHLDSFKIGFADYEKGLDEGFRAEKIINKFNEKVYVYEHIYTDEELEGGYVKGIVFALDDNFVEKNGVKENYPLIRRILYFNWLIKEGKVRNF